MSRPVSDMLRTIADDLDLLTGQSTACHVDGDDERARLYARAGLLRWSGAPNNKGWSPTATARQIINTYGVRHD